MTATPAADGLAYFEAHMKDKLLVTVRAKSPRSSAPVLRAVLKGIDYSLFQNTQTTFSNLGYDRRFILECEPVKKAPAGVMTIPFGELWPRMRNMAKPQKERI